MTLTNTMSWKEICEHVLGKIGHKIPAAQHDKFRRWFGVREKLGYLFDPVMILRVWTICQELESGLDHFVCLCGREGKGKSTLSFQLAAWVNPDGFSQKNIVFGAAQYLQVLKDKLDNPALKGKSESVCLDEGNEILSRETLAMTNRALVKSFNMQRFLNFFCCINIPNFFLLDTILRQHRVRTLIEVTNRGRYKAITGNGIAIINDKGRVTKQVDGVPLPYGVWWEGYFHKDFPPMIDRDTYERDKAASFSRTLSELQDELVVCKQVPVAKVAKAVGCSTDTVIGMIKKGKLVGKQIGAKWYVPKDAFEGLIKP